MDLLGVAHARQLAPRLTGATVRSFRIYDPLLRNGPIPRLAGRTILGVGRSGKQVLFTLSPGRTTGRALWLAVHLRMTGRLIWTDNDTARNEADPCQISQPMRNGADRLATRRRTCPREI